MNFLSFHYRLNQNLQLCYFLDSLIYSKSLFLVKGSLKILLWFNDCTQVAQYFFHFFHYASLKGEYTNYPHLPDLHDSHDDYPLAPSHWRLLVICIHQLSKQYFQILHLKGNSLPICGIKSGGTCGTLSQLEIIPPLGLVAIRVHRISTFKHSTWLKTCIDFNTRQRSLAGGSFLKDFFKLMNNTLFR